jgi:hypothetical protein
MIERGQVFVGQYYRHIKSGRIYLVTAEVKMKIDGSWVPGWLYQSEHLPSENEPVLQFTRTNYNFRESFEHVTD